jgi:hypothetical protein
MLLLKALTTALVSTVSLSIPSPRTSAAGIYLQIGDSRPTPTSVISASQNGSLVRVRLVDALRPGSAASVSLPRGSNDVFTIEVKRSTLSEKVLAAAFATLYSLATRRGTYPTANILVYIPDSLGARPVFPSDKAKYAHLIADLNAQPTGNFVEVSGG